MKLQFAVRTETDADIDAEVVVFAGDKMVQTGVLQNGLCRRSVWGDDPTTEEIDGAVEW